MEMSFRQVLYAFMSLNRFLAVKRVLDPSFLQLSFLLSEMYLIVGVKSELDDTHPHVA